VSLSILLHHREKSRAKQNHPRSLRLHDRVVSL